MVSNRKHKKNYLSKTEELNLGRIIKAYREGDKTITHEEAYEAHNILFENNVDYVYKLVAQFLSFTNSYYYEYEVAVQDALMELAKRLWEYDPDKGTRAITRIYYNVKKILSTNANKSRPIPLSDVAAYKYIQINKYSEEYESLNDKSNISKVDYISQQTGWKKDDILSLMHTNHENISSLDFTLNTDDGKQTSLGEILVVEEKNNTLSEETEELLDELPKEDKELILFAFDLEGAQQMSEDEFLNNLGINKKQYNRQVKLITKKLRDIAEDKEIKW